MARDVSPAPLYDAAVKLAEYSQYRPVVLTKGTTKALKTQYLAGSYSHSTRGYHHQSIQELCLDNSNSLLDSYQYHINEIDVRSLKITI